MRTGHMLIIQLFSGYWEKVPCLLPVFPENASSWSFSKTQMIRKCWWEEDTERCSLKKGIRCKKKKLRPLFSSIRKICLQKQKFQEMGSEWCSCRFPAQRAQRLPGGCLLHKTAWPGRDFKRSLGQTSNAQAAMSWECTMLDGSALPQSGPYFFIRCSLCNSFKLS